LNIKEEVPLQETNKQLSEHKDQGVI